VGKKNAAVRCRLLTWNLSQNLKFASHWKPDFMAEQGDSEKKARDLDILLSAYQMCNANRDHYDSERWIIGSVFLGASVAAFGISYLNSNSLLDVVAIALFSQLLFSIFVLYDQLVQPYVDISLARSREIEKTLDAEFGKGPGLHLLIHERTENRRLKGKYLVRTLIVITTGVWVLRLAVESWSRMTQEALLGGGSSALIILGVALFVYTLCYPHNVNIESAPFAPSSTASQTNQNLMETAGKT
jgi:hypothetical protein